jgi:predicted small metal-binding protein
MAYEFRCTDAGAACKGHFKADTEEQLERDVADHLRDKHQVQHVTQTLRNYVRRTATER